MNDAFGNELKLKDKVLYSPGHIPAAGTEYLIAEIAELRPATWPYSTDTVKLDVYSSSVRDNAKYVARSVRASNVVKIKGLK